MKTVITLKSRRSLAFAARLAARISVLCLLVVLFSTSAARHSLFAASHPKEKPYALIFGTVWGPDNHPLYGVKVKIRRAKDKHAKWELFSDHQGEFAQRVPAGESDYVLWADLKGYKPDDGKPLHLPQEVTIHVYNDERVDTGLHLAH
jgi:hypothetical protein